MPKRTRGETKSLRKTDTLASWQLQFAANIAASIGEKLIVRYSISRSSSAFMSALIFPSCTYLLTGWFNHGKTARDISFQGGKSKFAALGLVDLIQMVALALLVSTAIEGPYNTAIAESSRIVSDIMEELKVCSKINAIIILLGSKSTDLENTLTGLLAWIPCAAAENAVSGLIDCEDDCRRSKIRRAFKIARDIIRGYVLDQLLKKHSLDLVRFPGLSADRSNLGSGLKTQSETDWQNFGVVLNRLLERLQLDNAAPSDIQGLGILDKIICISI